MTTRTLVIASLVAAALAACEREKREFQSPPETPARDPTRVGAITPGGGAPLRPGAKPTPDRSELDENAYAVNQGKRLFRWYNCSGCHGGGGGGGMGVTLMDAEWRYGHQPAAIYASIVQGRPNGMPAFGGRIPDDQIWQLVAYVRSLSGQLRKDVAPSRADTLSGAPPENTRDDVRPRPAKASSGAQ
jgi:cytochrome c oxidase cbb3-type subunit III